MSDRRKNDFDLRRKARSRLKRARNVISMDESEQIEDGCEQPERKRSNYQGHGQTDSPDQTHGQNGTSQPQPSGSGSNNNNYKPGASPASSQSSSSGFLSGSESQSQSGEQFANFHNYQMKHDLKGFQKNGQHGQQNPLDRRSSQSGATMFEGLYGMSASSHFNGTQYSNNAGLGEIMDTPPSSVQDNVDDDGIFQNYDPALTRADNPYYYEQNKTLYQLYCERIKRRGDNSPYLYPGFGSTPPSPWS